ncbi:MAG: flagellin [Verrucomicrobiota bacterium]|jgi:flagellin
MTISTNVQALKNADNLEAVQVRLNKSLSRLSSGSKITSPADDCAGLAVSSRLDAQVQRTDAAQSNVTNALSFTQTQDGFLANIATALSRMSELSVQAQDQTKNDGDRQLYDKEFQQLSSYITSAASKDFDGVSLFSGNSLSVTLDADNATSLTMSGIDLTGLAAYSDATSANIQTTVAAVSALTAVKAAITQLSTDRATLGSYEARLNFTAEQLAVGKENLTAASSQIKDVDVADESTEYARETVLLQSTTAMLAQANQLPQTVLKLIA